MIAGTRGYERAIQSFIQRCQALNFQQMYPDFMRYMPSTGSAILDLGSGAGQNAAALSEMGYQVTAVEPMSAFLEAAKQKYTQLNINWLHGSLPELICLNEEGSKFEFILAFGVWHHLSVAQQECAMRRIAELLNSKAKFALTLRNGPAGLGSCVYPTDINRCIVQAEKLGLKPIFKKTGQPSLMDYKQEVRWAYLLLEKH